MSDPNTSKLRLFFITAVVAIAAIASFWWLKERKPVDDGDWMRAAACPEHEIKIETEHGTFVTTIPVAPNIATIPEFHDCQRFLVKPGTQPVAGPAFGVHTAGAAAVTYGPLVAIWVGEAVDTLFQELPSLGLPGGGGGELADSLGDSLLPMGGGGPGDSVAFAVAQIHSWGPETYSPLFIRPGFSCLYMWRDSQAPYTWRAMIVWTGARPDPCHDPERIAGLDGPMLEVRPVVNDEFKKGDIPPVARWDRDPGRGDQYIGIKCGRQWCEVGRQGFTSSGAAADEGFATAVDAAMEERPGGSTPMPVTHRKRVLGVKGWYDQQMLATRANNILGPSGTVGTIIPHPLVQGDQLTEASFDHTWVQVAFVHVTGEYAGEHLTLHQGLTEMHFCRGTAERCGIPAGTARCKQTMPTGPDSWWVRLTHGDDPPAYRCIARDVSTPPIPAGAARWRWLEDDETTWVRCPQGCCTTQ